MAMLKRIKDPLRLKDGDLVILPADYSGRLRLRTHLSLHTLGKLGLSVGSARRPTDDKDTVKERLVDGPEETKYVIITYAGVSETDLARRKYASLMTNDSRKELVPEVNSISIARIAAPGEDATLAEAAQFCRTYGRERVFGAMSRTFLGGSLVFSRRREGGDAELANFFNILYVETPSKPVPCCYKPLEGTLTAAQVSDSFGDILDDVYAPKITIPAKSISALAERGYVFARPDAEFTDMMARSCVKALLAEAVRGWKERGAILADYMKKVRLVADTINMRLKAYDRGAKRTWVKAGERRTAAKLSGRAID